MQADRSDIAPRKMALHELRHRPASAVVFLLGVAIPAAFVTALLLTSGRHAEEAEHLLRQKESDTDVRMRTMQHTYARIGRRMGQDVTIVPDDAKVDEVRNRGFSSQTMPESVTAMLIDARPADIDHVVPRLGRMIEWTERGTEVLLVGLGREHVFDDTLHPEPFVASVPEGFARVGHQVAHELELSTGQVIVLRGQRFTVAECLDEQGSLDDVSVWVNLKQAQDVLGAEGRVSDILALTSPADTDRVEAFRRALDGVLDGVKALPAGLTVRTRGRILDAAGGVSHDVVAMERAHHEALSADRARSLGVLVAVAAICCAVWVAIVSFVNTYRRRREIGVLRTVGWSRSRVVSLFAWKGFALSAVGSVTGLVAGFAAVSLTAGSSRASADIGLLALVGCGTFVIALVGSVIPAVAAAARNPAETIAGA